MSGNLEEVELIKVKAEQEVKLRWIPGFQSGLGRLLEMNKVLRKDRSRSAMLLRDLKDYLQNTLRMIPQTRIISQLDDDKDEEEDYNETIQEEDERCTQPEHLGRGPLPMALIPEHQSIRGPTKTEGWDDQDLAGPLLRAC
ncbi:hypothetical protein BY996DRAFT_6525083 [Phakopsora pachyrhizi]|nr:hypothetical protein BY996DRAFT_6525083 [Phakopsora pachyrhizi]